MYRFIVNKRYVNLLKTIAKPGKHDILDMSKETGITYSRLSNIIMQFARERIVQKERSDEGPGRKLDISITEKGKLIIGFFDQIEKVMLEEMSEEEITERGWKNETKDYRRIGFTDCRYYYLVQLDVYRG